MNFTDSGLLDIYRLELYNKNQNILTAEDLNQPSGQENLEGGNSEENNQEIIVEEMNENNDENLTPEIII